MNHKRSAQKQSSPKTLNTAKANAKQTALDTVSPLKLVLLLVLVYVCGLSTGWQFSTLRTSPSIPLSAPVAITGSGGVDSVTLNPGDLGWLSAAKESTVIVSTPRGHGSGVCIDYDGDWDVVLTAKHVIADLPLDTEIKFQWASGDTDFQRSGQIGTVSAIFDLATVRSLDPSHVLRKVNLAATSPSIGLPVIAIGFPRDVYPPFTTIGFVASYELLGTNLYIAHSASIFFGNSGGPLFNWKGELVGINVMIGIYNGHVASDRGLAVSVADIVEFLEEKT